MPSISIILQLSDFPEKLYQAIDSILQQTFKDIELIIVNTSTHSCKKIINHCKKNDLTLRLFTPSPKTHGLCSWLYGISKAESEIILFMSPNSLLFDKFFLEAGAQMANSTNHEYLHFHSCYLDSTGECIDNRPVLRVSPLSTQEKNLATVQEIPLPFNLDSAFYSKKCWLSILPALQELPAPVQSIGTVPVLFFLLAATNHSCLASKGYGVCQSPAAEGEQLFKESTTLFEFQETIYNTLKKTFQQHSSHIESLLEKIVGVACGKMCLYFTRHPDLLETVIGKEDLTQVIKMLCSGIQFNTTKLHNIYVATK